MHSLKARSELKKAIRLFFEPQGYLEVDTPMMVVTPGTETYLRYFQTKWFDHSNSQQIESIWLRSSPELHMKKICSNGFDKIFQIGPCFRNGGEISDWHHPEFTLLEWYEKDLSFNGLIDQTENLISHCIAHMQQCGFTTRKNSDFKRMTVADAFYKTCGVALEDNDTQLADKLTRAGLNSMTRQDDFETAFFKGMLERVEPALKDLGHVSLFDYPASQAALSKVEGHVAKRCEVYIDGVEISNGFSELLNPISNRKRIADTNIKRKDLGFEVPGEDEGFYHAMSKLDSEGRSLSGNALGFERLLAVILGQNNLSSLIPFRNDIFHNFI